MLLDTGPLVALLDRDEVDHDRCTRALDSMTFPLATTWPVITEAMHLARRAMGAGAQQSIWRMLDRGIFGCVDPNPDVVARTQELMTKYADTPMAFADATLVALAEQRDDADVFTLDSDFQVYRLHGRRRFRIVPDLG